MSTFRDAEARILRHMNADHADSLLHYAQYFAKCNEAKSATMVSIDATSFSLDVQMKDETSQNVSIMFQPSMKDPREARERLILMANEAEIGLGIFGRRKWPSEPVPSIIIFGMVLFMVVSFAPENKSLYPFEWARSLGLILFRSRQMMQIGVVVAWCVHFLEALYGVSQLAPLPVPKAYVYQWFLQTVLLGYPSLRGMLNVRARIKKFSKSA
eukprot:TRINITY_DN13246_c0_g1::TRINITY_DN13246_c0_g1_i1::g.12603::m.12603 TRINITY_DN13246_c0_g1::TRINITY_DN13246_c0_g1_i1::g.12603  ORF type:complete len:221 (+),score=21.00,DUF2470/PF10615.4/2.6e-21,DUF4499/PF14934.1/5.8e-16 TRINITY_DN13246_c0_g1_i1:27-665(+)